MATQAALLSPAPVARGIWSNPDILARTDRGRDFSAAATLSAGTVVQFSQDQQIYGDGDAAGLFYKVVSGVVRNCKFLDDGRRQIEAFYVAGDMLGFEAGVSHEFSAEAVLDCTLIAYRRRGFDAVAVDEPLRSQVFTAMMRNLARAQQHSLSLGCKSALEKVAAFLIECAARSPDGKSVAGQSVTLAMSRQDIGDYLGLTIETVSRMITQLGRQGLIELVNARKIVLKDIGALAMLGA